MYQRISIATFVVYHESWLAVTYSLLWSSALKPQCILVFSLTIVSLLNQSTASMAKN